MGKFASCVIINGLREKKNLASVRIVKDKLNMKKFPNKRKARIRTKTLINNKTLIKIPCQICGSIEVECHHLDYSKPSKIMWLCKQHHKEWHKNNPKLKGYTDWPSIKIDAETYDKLKRLADKRQESFSTLISLILKKYV